MVTAGWHDKPWGFADWIRISALRTIRGTGFTTLVIDLIDLANVDTKSLQIGKVQVPGGRAAFDFIERSVRLALERKADAMPPPISKESLKAAG